MFVPRKWQKECLERCRQRFDEGRNDFVLEATMGAGKSSMAAWLAKTMIEEYGVDHVLVLVPWKSIQGDAEKGMLGSFGELGLDAREFFFTLKRRQACQPIPQNDATVTLYQEVCNQEAIKTLQMWTQRGFKFALICDEIHHTNEINSSWGAAVEDMAAMASYSVFMSGTYFRGDRKPISCIEREPETDSPIKHFAYTYPQGVKDNVVRSVTTRHINARVTIHDSKFNQTYDLALDEIGAKELSAAKKQVLDPYGECMRHMIETVHEAMTRTRQKFPDAACLFVCRPGSGDNYTAQGAEGLEDKHVHQIASQIKALTGMAATVVTHKDKDARGSISRFRRASDPYLVAVNMVSEGCDIPRLRAVAFCRYTTSEMLFRQIVGRALRMHTGEDGTAAQIYIPTFPRLVEFAKRVWTEAQEGVRDRRCPKCGGWPCECPCPACGKRPCECPSDGSKDDRSVVGLDAIPIMDGGHMGSDDVRELYVQAAHTITRDRIEHLHANVVQLGHALQLFHRQLDALQESIGVIAPVNPVQERERLQRKIVRQVRRLGFEVYDKDFQTAFVTEIQRPFGQSWEVISNTWSVDRLRDVQDRLERRITEIFR
jgi:superfamily II DNA or RNA helicase